MAGSFNATGQAEQDLEAVLAEYLRSAEAGRAPDRMELLARHPDLAPELAAFFAGQDRFSRLAAPLREAVTAVQESTIEDKLAEGGRLGDFRIVREIGRGGMGVVYEAEQISLGRKVALKILPFAATLDQRQLQRFKNESLAAAQLDHPHIVDVYGVGTDRGVHYYAMRLIDGQTLARVIADLRLKMLDAQKQPAEGASAPQSATDSTPTVPYLPQHAFQGEDRNPKAENSTAVALTTDHSIKSAEFFRKVAEMGQYIAEALHQGHEQGIIHRDIKPSNLMLDSRGKVWVTDFGLAHVQGDKSLTMTGDLVGTLRYMSPEQALAKRVVVDHRTDIYSLGATLYELLTLEPAYGANDRQELLRQIAFEEPHPPRRINKSIPPELETIVQKAMEKNPDDRYATGQELADDLHRYRQHEPIRAKRPTWIQRASKWSRRHPAVVRSTVFMLFLITAGSMLSTWLVWQEKKRTGLERDRAENEKRIAQQEKQIAQVVRDFLQKKLLRQANLHEQAASLLVAGTSPAETKPNPTIRELLDRAAAELTPERIEANFPNQPLIQAEILQTVGATYGGVGEYDQAIAHLDRSRALREAELGPDHPDTLLTRVDLGRAYHNAGRRAEALRLFEEVLPKLQLTLGPSHPDTLVTLSELAFAYGNAGRLPEAIRLREEVHEKYERSLGPDHPDTLVALVNVVATGGRQPEALRILEQVRPKLELTLGPDHPNTLGTLYLLAVAFMDAGRMQEGLHLLEQVRDKREQKLGPDHLDTLASLNSVAWAYWKAGKLDRSVPLFEQLLPRRQAKLGNDHPHTFQAAFNLGVNYRDAGRLDDAVSIFDEWLPRAEAKLQPPSGLLLEGRGMAAETYQRAGQFDRAIMLRRATVADARRAFSAGDPRLAAELASLGFNLLVAQQPVEAEEVLRESLAIREEKEPDAWTTFNCRSMLGAALLGQKRYAAAEPLLLQGYGGMKQREAKIPAAGRVHLPKALERLVQLYDTWGKPEQAAQWRTKLKEQKSKTAPQPPPKEQKKSARDTERRSPSSWEKSP